MKVVNKTPFSLYPSNKMQSYSFYGNAPIIIFEFDQSVKNRLIEQGSLRLNGVMRILDKNTRKFPSNRFDIRCSEGLQKDYEKVCYMDNRVSVSSCFQTVTISNVTKNQIFENIKDYPRMLSSLIASTSSYYDLCGTSQNTWASYANNDSISRVCSGIIPFSISFYSGYLKGSDTALQNGLRISINLNSDSNVLYGLNGADFIYELTDLFLSGNYLEINQQITQKKGIQSMYYQFQNYLNTITSSDDHQNLNLGLSNVISLYSNFIPSKWVSNFKYNSFSTPKLKNSDEANANIYQTTFLKDATRYPLAYIVDERNADKDRVFDVLRSRLFLDSVKYFNNLTHSTISSATENILNMKSKRTDWFLTPPECDGDNIPSWQFNDNDEWTRDGEVESSGRVYGVGVRMDMANIGLSSNYSQSTYNYNIQSSLQGTTPNNVSSFVLAKTIVVNDGHGNITYQN